MSFKEKKIQFPIKITKEHRQKIEKESNKVWLTMSGFMSMLIETYKYTEIIRNNIPKNAVRVSDWENTYSIPKALEKDFEKDCIHDLVDWSHLHLQYCNDFETKYWQYKI